MPTRVLITGASGNVGSEVAAACIQQGLEVRLSTRGPAAAGVAGAQTVPFDFEDTATWQPALAGCDQVFLLRPPPLGNMRTTLNPFIDAAYAQGIEHIVFLSVAGAQNMSWVPHRKVELHLEASGKRWSVLRPGFFAQNLSDAYRRDIVEDHRLYVPAGAGRVAFVDLRDVGQVAAKIFSSPAPFRGQALTLTGPAAVSFAEVAGWLTEALGRQVVYQPASLLGYAWHLWSKRKLPLMQVVVQAVLHRGLRHGAAEPVDPTLVSVLGRPGTSMRDFIARSVARWQVTR